MKKIIFKSFCILILALSFLSLFYSPNKSPKGVNYFRYQNPTFDRLYKKALHTTHEEEKINCYNQMNAELKRDMPTLPLYYDEAIRLVQKSIVGLPIHALNALDLKRVKRINATAN